MTSMRARNKDAIFRNAVENIVNKLANAPTQPVRVSTRLATYVLLNYETIMSSGRLYSTQVRNIGAGVKELYLRAFE